MFSFVIFILSIIDTPVVLGPLFGSSILMGLKRKKKSLQFGIRNKNLCFFMLVISWVGSWSLKLPRVPVGTAVLHPQPWSA